MTVRAVVTGIGVTAPTGLGVADYWAATLRGDTAIAKISRFVPDQYPARLAGEVRGFDAVEHLPGRLLPQTDRMTQLALVAADWAFADAALAPGDLAEYEAGVVTASSAGGFEFGQRELRNLWRDGGQYVSAYQSFAWFYAVNTGQISIRNGLRGPCGTLVSDQAGGLDALAQARRSIRHGIRAMVSGAVDASICPWGWVAQIAGGRLSSADRPDVAYLPFTAAAAGHVPGEGGALMIVEDEDSARRRGAPVYGEIAGYGTTFDPAPGSGGEPGMRWAIELALDDAGVAPADVDAVFADAAAVPELDRIESAAITAVFGPRGVPVTAPKTATGRLYSGAGALDVATALLSIRDGLVPHTPLVRPAEEHRIDLVVERPRVLAVRTCLILARGHGGFNSALVVRALDRTT